MTSPLFHLAFNKKIETLYGCRDVAIILRQPDFFKKITAYQYPQL